MNTESNSKLHGSLAPTFGPKTRAQALADYERGLLTPVEFDTTWAGFSEPQIGDVILPRDMRPGDLLEPTFGMGMPWRLAFAERIDAQFVHLARPYAMVPRVTETAATILLGTEHYPVERSARHLAYVLVQRDLRP